ncbi:MAG: phosphoglucomutase/phosphomannomutase family protein [Candidatus Omnitrophica bacterium]|nr:phosphoglucomutase/phosphomannomutase family protein [Candidatus Omnitrophota bacterium]
MQEIKFGTDGFRGIIADTFTFENVQRISLALSVYLKKYKQSSYKKGIALGYDKRFLSNKFAQATANILSQNCVPVFITEQPIPTQAVSLYVRANRLACGIVLTASHNPYDFNGFKIKDEFGATASKDMTNEIELIIRGGLNVPRLKSDKPAKIMNVDMLRPYIVFLKNYLDMGIIRKNKFRILVDAMHGAGAGIVETVLKNSLCQVETIRANHDVLFGGVNPEPIAENLLALDKALKLKSYDLAIALDGDADRIGAMCPDGQLISSHLAICLILLHFVENKKMTGKVVKSITTTTLVDKITAFYNLELEEVAVGFKNIAAKMIKEDVLIGGEESGGIGFKNYMPERDGVLSGLLLLELMACRKQGIIEIINDMQKRFGKFFYLRRDLKIKVTKPIARLKNILGQDVVEVKTYDGTKFIMRDESWLLIRSSGTEPVARIYAESKTLKRTKALIDFGCALL